jgi:hypothetical protein
VVSATNPYGRSLGFLDRKQDDIAEIKGFISKRSEASKNIQQLKFNLWVSKVGAGYIYAESHSRESSEGATHGYCMATGPANKDVSTPESKVNRITFICLETASFN